MQLFITDDFKISNNKVSITEERIIKQLKKVLRARPGYTFFLQPKTTSNIQKRYFCKILEINNYIQAQIVNVEEKKLNLQTKGVITSFLNKFDKMELIVQKLTEILVPIIGFVPTQRSQIKIIPQKKIERWHKILLEAAEQSFSWFLPEIKIFESLSQIPWTKWILNFDWKLPSQASWNFDFLLIGPEWGFTLDDIKKISPIENIKLGENVLRAGTAAIIWGYLYKWDQMR